MDIWDYLAILMGFVLCGVVIGILFLGGMKMGALLGVILFGMWIAYRSLIGFRK